MNEGPYRASDIVNAPPPNGIVALIWRWILLRRAERLEAEERKVPLALVAPVPKSEKRVTIRMVRSDGFAPYKVERVVVSSCPGKSAQRPSDVSHHFVFDYWLCTDKHCCCEVQE
jgi:hypothetical protein